MTEKQAAFEGWAIVELFGHAKEIGYVTTQNFGSACLFQIDVPPLPEREIIIQRTQYVQHEGEEGIHWTPAGSKVKRLGSPGRSPLIGPGAIYKLTPCTQETAMIALEEFFPRPMILLELAKESRKELTLPGVTVAQDRTFSCCGGNPEDGHDVGCVNDEVEQEDEQTDDIPY